MHATLACGTWLAGGWDDTMAGVDYVLSYGEHQTAAGAAGQPAAGGLRGDMNQVNALADAAPGFVWRLQTEDGNATAVRAFEL